MWQGLFWVMVFVSASLAYTTWGALRYGIKLEDELAEARSDSRRHLTLVTRAHIREEPFPEGNA